MMLQARLQAQCNNSGRLSMDCMCHASSHAASSAEQLLHAPCTLCKHFVSDDLDDVNFAVNVFLHIENVAVYMLFSRFL